MAEGMEAATGAAALAVCERRNKRKLRQMGMSLSAWVRVRKLTAKDSFGFAGSRCTPRPLRKDY